MGFPEEALGIHILGDNNGVYLPPREGEQNLIEGFQTIKSIIQSTPFLSVVNLPTLDKVSNTVELKFFNDFWEIFCICPYV